MDIHTIRELLYARQVRFTAHAHDERGEARLSESEVEEALLSGDIIDTESDVRGPKYRVQGETFYTRRTLEVIVAVKMDEESEREFVSVITVYERKPKRGGRSS